MQTGGDLICRLRAGSHEALLVVAVGQLRPSGSGAVVTAKWVGRVGGRGHEKVSKTSSYK